MGSDIHPVERSSSMDMQIQIGVEVPKIGRVHQDVVLVWDLA